MIKFNKHNVTAGNLKARVRYSLGNHVSGQPCVWLYAKDFEAGETLAQIFPGDHKNDSDSREDYFEKGRVILFADHPLYEAARECALEQEQAAKKVNDRLHELGTTYHEGLPLDTIATLLTAHGFRGEAMDGIYTGAEGRMSEKISAKRWIHMTWFKMPSGRFEVVAYVN